MINNYLERQIKENFSYEPTVEQEITIKNLSLFLTSPSAHSIFLLRGYAGTGKTSLVSALVKTMDSLKQKVVLLAPTGRAAKVFALYANHPAFTIHKRIYRQSSYSNSLDNFSLNDNLQKNTLFIVDESSMISNDGGSVFGSGRLLDDLITFVYSGEGCRLLLMGDTAQLPPVGEELSPALYADALRCYGMDVVESTLTQVVRQEEGSGILWNATQLRRLMDTECVDTLPKIRTTGFSDICRLPGAELIEKLTECYSKDGMDDTIVVCRSNKRANIYNNGIRAQILFREEELETGDMLMIAKNNYFWTENCKEMDFIANGEIAIVRRVRRTQELYGFRFAEATLRFPAYDDIEIDVKLLLDTLHSDSPALSREDNDKLFNAVMDDYADVTTKAGRMKKLKSDPFYNALQVKYAYAVTCHKAQGGQWSNVFLDQGYMTDEFLTPDYFRWLYTAFTRATSHLYLVNYPEKQIE
jgi:exodeoxyribonuclease-5